VDRVWPPHRGLRLRDVTSWACGTSALERRERSGSSASSLVSSICTVASGRRASVFAMSGRRERVYDRIGRGYAIGRRTDARWMAALEDALGDARTVVNVGAGTGSYESPRRQVVAVEPSATMIAQRPSGAAPVVQAVAEDLPIADASLDAATAVLTIHHWHDLEAGLAELRRVAGRQVVLTFDPHALDRLWLVRDYLPEIATVDAQRLPTTDRVVAALGEVEVRPLPVPRDMRDGMLAAFWARPEAYLDPRVRAGMSIFALMDPAVVDAAMGRLRADLDDGTWACRNAELADLEALDAGYQLLVAGR
jgi:SAM-dependent methyltransferase